jgi:hypothetical protein
MFEVMFYLFKCFCIGTGVALCVLIAYRVREDWRNKTIPVDLGCDHDWYTYEVTKPWIVRRDLEKIPNTPDNKPSCYREFEAMIPRLGEGSLERRICLKCRAIEDEITPYIQKATADRERELNREQRAAELLAEVKHGD